MIRRIKISILRSGYMLFVKIPKALFYFSVLFIDNFSVREDKKILRKYAIWFCAYTANKEGLYSKNNLVENNLHKLVALNAVKNKLYDKLPALLLFKKNISMADGSIEKRIFETKLSKLQPTKLYSLCRKSAYMLLTNYGDLKGAKQAFDQLDSVSQLQKKELKNKCEIMKLMLRDIAKLEERLAYDFKDWEQTGEKSRLVISILVWGDYYINLFTKFCIPSLKAPGNLNNLENVEICWHIFTTTEGHQLLSKNEEFCSLCNIESVRFEIIPDEIINISTRNNRYWILGAYTQTSLRYAAYLNADVHFTNPDIVYSRNFFKNIFKIREQKDINLILSSSFSTKYDEICSELEELKNENNCLNISASDLHVLGLNYLQNLYKYCFLSPKEMQSGHLPGMPLLAWQDENSLVVHIRYLNPMLIDKSLLAKNMQLSYYTIDSEIIKILQKDNADKLKQYILSAEDDIGFIEISEIKSENTNYTINRNKFKQNFQGAKGEDAFKVFCEELRLPIRQSNNFSALVSNDANSCSQQFEQLKKEIKDYLMIVR